MTWSRLIEFGLVEPASKRPADTQPQPSQHLLSRKPQRLHACLVLLLGAGGLFGCPLLDEGGLVLDHRRLGAGARRAHQVVALVPPHAPAPPTRPDPPQPNPTSTGERKCEQFTAPPCRPRTP